MPLRAARLLGVLFFSLSFLAPAKEARVPPRQILTGKIAEVRPRESWLSIYSPEGLLFLVAHPHAFFFKQGTRASLASFKPGEEIAALSAGVRRGDTVLILALEDRDTYSRPPPSRAVSPFQNPGIWETGPDAKLPIPQMPDFVPPVPQSEARGPAAPKKTFVQLDGTVETVSKRDRTFDLALLQGGKVHVETRSRTKVYTYTGGKFILLTFEKIVPGKRVRAGGFRRPGKEETIQAESVLFLPKPPRLSP